MEIKLRMPRFPRIPYFVLSVALDVLAAGLGVLGGAENAMLAVKSKRGVEAFVRQSAGKLAEWRGNAEPELAPIDAHDLAEERGSWTSRYAQGDPGNRYPAARYGSAYERSGLPFPERW
jgi:hypothetical protein